MSRGNINLYLHLSPLVYNDQVILKGKVYTATAASSTSITLNTAYTGIRDRTLVIYRYGLLTGTYKLKIPGYTWTTAANGDGAGGDETFISTELQNAITTSFGTWDAAKQSFKQAALTRFGSGWAYFYFDKTEAKVKVASYPNQEDGK